MSKGDTRAPLSKSGGGGGSGAGHRRGQEPAYGAVKPRTLEQGKARVGSRRPAVRRAPSARPLRPSPAEPGIVWRPKAPHQAFARAEVRAEAGKLLPLGGHAGARAFLVTGSQGMHIARHTCPAAHELAGYLSSSQNSVQAKLNADARLPRLKCTHNRGPRRNRQEGFRHSDAGTRRGVAPGSCSQTSAAADTKEAAHHPAGMVAEHRQVW